MELQKVKIKRIIGPTPSGAAVLLGNDAKTFVVFVGFYEAAALIREINKEVPARPLTHELIQNVFLGFDVTVKQVIISTIIENTFCATLILQQGNGNGNGEMTTRSEVRIDARPSDCFVLAMKNNVDLFVTQEVFDEVQDVTKMTDEVESNLAAGQLGPGVSTPFGVAGNVEFDDPEEAEAEGESEGEEGLTFPPEGVDFDFDVEMGDDDEDDDDDEDVF